VVGHQPSFHPDPGTVDLLRPVRRITPAELRVLRFVALGMTSREIAERLWVSRQAVTYHIGNLFMKLRADTRAGLVARAYAMGILSPGTWPPAIDPGYVSIAFAASSRGFLDAALPGGAIGRSATSSPVGERGAHLSAEAG
jgi:DNA-binding CsgD family transcriptional regulator